MSTVQTKQDRVLSALQNGERLTAKQIGHRFSVGNPTATVSALRMKGYPVYLNTHRDTKGRVTQKYRLGSASRRVIAAGYQALASTS